ncbi:LysR substrate binding domain-containing protein [Friedmanniella luteola]|uniref:LysR substrate binding domain-containing protein n=1 Tax=Friedmanniella luteola TaxID=546871 RepID=A0A1H2A876_9ACTN|nr:LysR family substrate-binding domain-containing protein [Friedmanniella luteola]SDT42168.1 LysR substrate binding domain-containing protein [Friedmanniella luteola]
MSPSPADDGPRAVPTLRVGHVPGVTVSKWRRIWAERFPRLGLDVVAVDEADQHAALTGEVVDLCFVRLPLEDPGLHLIPLWTEQRVVVAPKDHPVAVFDAVTLADLADEDVLEGFAGDEALDLVAGGAGVVYLPQAVARAASRKDLVHRPVTDAAPTQIGLAWLRENPHEMIEEFVGIVRGRTANSSRSSQASAAAPEKKPPVTKPPKPRTAARSESAPGRTRGARRPGRGRGR